MSWLMAAFRENTQLEHEESAKIFFFLLKAVSAIAYVFVLGYLAAGMPIENTVWIVLIIGAAFDLAPELYAIKIAMLLPKRAQQAEIGQFVLTVVAYLWLVMTLFVWAPFGAFGGYAVFAVLWLTSFVIEESVLFLVRTD